MTCIVGMLDKETNTVYLGGDSLGSNGYHKSVYKQRKVFHSKDTKEFIIGLSGTFNFQALEYENLLDELKLSKNEINREYLITRFIPNLKNIVNKYNSNSNSNGINTMEGTLLFGYKDKLFKVQSDYSLLEPEDEYLSIGSGEDFATGSLATTEGMELTTIERIHKALRVASKHGVGIQAPFYIINTKDDKVIEFLD